MARVRARAVHLHGINTLYHAVSVYTGMHKALETLETLALRARVSKPVSAVLYIPVYTSTAWYNLYVNGAISHLLHLGTTWQRDITIYICRQRISLRDKTTNYYILLN